jgi:hypothetical protein
VGGAVTRTVYLNGTLVAEEDIAFSFLPTSVEITPFISQGLNTIAVYAEGGSDLNGFSLLVSVWPTDGRELSIVSDSSWVAWDERVEGWTQPGFDDSVWKPVRFLRSWNNDPNNDAWEIQEAVWDLNGGEFARPSVPESPDILVGYQWDYPRADAPWQSVRLRPETVQDVENPTAFVNLESLLTSEPDVTVLGAGGLTLDFGRELAGWVEFASPDLAASVVISAGENLDPRAALSGAVKGYQRGDTRVYRLILDEKEGLYTGVRYAWLKVGEVSSPWRITDLRVNWLVKPANYRGSFQASDPDLTRMWYVGAYSVRLNFAKEWITAILRPRGDRFPWAGDNRISDLTSLVAFGNYDFVSQDIDYWDPWVKKPLPRSFNGIPGYTLHWMLNVVNQLRYTGDVTEFEARVADLQSLLEEFEGYYDDPDNAGLNFIDFGAWGTNLRPMPSRPNVKKAYQMMYIQTLMEVAWAMNQVGRTDLGAYFDSLADTHVEELRAEDPSWAANAERHVAANALLAGFPNEQERRQIWEVDFAHLGERLTVTPFFTYFIADALARDNRHAAALEAIREMWGGMNAMSATCYWENYDVDWPGLYAPSMPWLWSYMSFCHPWASGVTPWLSNEVLGVKPVAPGFGEYDVLPHLGDLSWVRGGMPTPQGIISVSHEMTYDVFTTTLQSPNDTTGRLGVPKRDIEILTVNINDVLAWDTDGFHPVEGVEGAYEDADFVYFTGVQPGTFAVTAQYGGVPNEPAIELPDNIVVDDEDGDVVFDTADWQVVHNFWKADAYGIGFHSADPGDGDVTFTFKPSVPRAGIYRVFAMWAEMPSAATNTPFTINYDGGSEDLQVDQQINGLSHWNYLGTFPFAAGTTGSIIISNTPDGIVVADAIRLEWVSEPFTLIVK